MFKDQVFKTRCLVLVKGIPSIKAGEANVLEWNRMNNKLRCDQHLMKEWVVVQ